MSEIAADDMLAQALADFLAIDDADAETSKSAMSPLSADILADFLGLDRDAASAVNLPRPAVVDSEADEPAPSLRAMIAEQHAAEPDREPWPAEWFNHTDSGQIRACQALWGAALIGCIRDALDADSRSVQHYNGVSRTAISWFSSKDFHIMCALAGLDGVACMERLTDPTLRDGIMARFLGEPKGGASHKIRLQAGPQT